MRWLLTIENRNAARINLEYINYLSYILYLSKMVSIYFKILYVDVA